MRARFNDLAAVLRSVAFRLVKVTVLYDEETEEYIGDVEELSGKIADLTKTASKPGGISLFTDANKTTYKSTYQLLKEIAEIYDDLTDRQQAGLLEALAGKRQGQILAATITNFDAAEEALRNMTNSAGNAEAEMEVIRDSAEYALNELKETFTSLAQNSVSRNGLKDLIKAGTSILGIVNDVVEKIGLIPAILTTIIGITASKKMTKGLFGYNYATGKMTAGGVDVGKGWIGGIKTQISDSKMLKAEVKANQQALIDFENEMNKGVVTQQTYNKVMNSSDAAVRKFGEGIMNGTAAAKDYTAAVGKIGIGAKAAAMGVQILNTAVSMLISMGVSLVINSIIKTIDDSANSLENHANKLSELTSKEKSLKSEIDELNGQLTDTKEKIAELEAMPDLTLLEKGELENLKAANDELERQIRLKRGELSETSYDKNKEAQALWEDMSGSPSWYTFKNPFTADNIFEGLGNAIWDLLPPVQWASNAFTGIERIVNDERIYAQMDNLEKYKELLEEINEIKETDEYKNGDSEITKQVDELQEALDELHDKNEKAYSGFWVPLSANLDPNLTENKEALDTVNELIEEWEKLTKLSYKNFAELYNDAKFAVTRKQLEDLAAAGKLTSESFKELSETDIAGIDDFREALEEIEDLTVEDVIEAIIKAAEKSGKEFKNAAREAKNYADTLKGLEDVINNLISKQEKLADAFKKTRLNGTLSAKEMLELVQEMPDLAQYVKEIGDGYTIAKEGFGNVNRENRKEMIDAITKRMDDIKEQIWLVEERNEVEAQKNALFDSLDKAWAKDPYSEESKKISQSLENVNEYLKELNDKINASENADNIYDLNEAYNGLITTLNLINDTFDKTEAEIEGVNEAYDNAKSEISEYNKDIQTLNEAIKTLNSGILLSYDEMCEIVDIAPELEDSFKQQGTRYSIATDLLEKWQKKSYEARNSYIDDLIAVADAERDMLSEQGTATANKRIEALEDYINRLQALRKDITIDDDDDLSKELQNQIDYYKTILEAVGAVKDKYADAIDKEIDALEESKDALKDANDERDRELKLIEARNNLENAKKRKVWVYTEGEGFKQVRDEKAVKEAEDAYRDAITDIQVAEIDAAIEEKEKQKEALEENTKALLDLEQDIQDALTISKAMSALGLSDPAQLLTLPDAVKQDIADKLADAMLKKDAEDNKENAMYVPVTLDSVLEKLGSSVKASDLNSSVFDNVKQAAYDSAVKGFVDTLKASADNMVNNVSYNNSPTFNANFNIYDANDPDAVAVTVRKELQNFLIEYNNSIK